MSTPFRPLVLFLCLAVFSVTVLGQQRTPPLTAAEIEAAYTEAIQKRTVDIVVALAIEDLAKSNRVAGIITRQYRALRARDEVIQTAAEQETPEAEKIRNDLYDSITKPLHRSFLAKLATELKPDQIEIVKDRMTYNKLKVTYEAYCNIIPNLTADDKAKIVEELTKAREEAMDGGSAAKKTAIFQKYKDVINAYLDAHGHDVAKAYAEWNLKQGIANKDGQVDEQNSATATQ